MRPYFNTVADALALIGAQSKVSIEYAADSLEEDAVLFRGDINDVPYQVSSLPLDFFDGICGHSFFDAANGAVGILAKIKR